MEMLLIGASVLIFKSRWAFLDSIPWASDTVALAVLLVVGLVAAVVALRLIKDKLVQRVKRCRRAGVRRGA